MLGAKRWLALICLLIIMGQEVLLQDDDDDGETRRKNKGGFRGGSDDDSEGGCQTLTMASLRLVCQGPDGETSCMQPEVGTKAKAIFKKTIAKKSNNAGVSEITCKSPGVWKPDASRSTSRQSRNANGYTYVNGIGSYKLYKDKKPWDQASDICQQDGGQLLVVDTADELTAIQRICDNQAKFTKADEGLYLGVTDKEVEGNLKTVHGKTFTNGNILDWAPSQPDNLNNEDCIMLAFPDFWLTDINCMLARPFMCELYDK